MFNEVLFNLRMLGGSAKLYTNAVKCHVMPDLSSVAHMIQDEQIDIFSLIPIRDNVGITFWDGRYSGVRFHPCNTGFEIDFDYTTPESITHNGGRIRIPIGEIITTISTEYKIKHVKVFPTHDGLRILRIKCVKRKIRTEHAIEDVEVIYAINMEREISTWQNMPTNIIGDIYLEIPDVEFITRPEEIEKYAINLYEQS